MLDKDRIVTLDAELVTTPIPQDLTNDLVGGLSTKFVVNTQVQWEKRQLLLLKQKPWWIPKAYWHWMVRTLLVQSTTFK